MTIVRKLALAAVAASGLVAAHGASAQTVLTFEGVGNDAGIADFYNGGTDTQGHSGTNYGISFSSSALGLIDNQHGGSGNFQNEPSVATVLYFPNVSSAILNDAAGFTTGFSFYYSSAAAGSVNVYSGLNATGTLLGTVAIAAQNNVGCTNAATGYCNWTASGVSFAGAAQSISFGGAAGYTAFDNITFGSATAGTGAVPEPATWGMMILGFGLVGFALRRAVRRSEVKFDAKIKRIAAGEIA